MALSRGGDRPTVGRLLLLFLVLLLALQCAVAQPLWPSLDNNTRDGGGGSGAGGGRNNNKNNNNNSNYGLSTTFNPSMAIVIVILISAFFFLGFFSIYIRQCGGVRGNSLSLARAGVGGAALSRPPRGLDLELLATFPTLAYSEVKGLKIGKGALECAVCLCEFEDDETLRLLPKCSHVFHPDCIDAWLASHITCPVCRSDLADVTPDDDPSVEVPAVEQETALPDHVAIAVGEGASEERKAELADLARIGSLRRGARFPRSHSTGHSLVQVHVQQHGDTDNNDRFTLRLPEHIRQEIVSTGRMRMRRAESVRSFLVGGLEGSSRRGYRGDAVGVGEGSIRRGRSIRLGRSDRWPSFFIRNFSARMPAWASGRRGDGEGSMKKGDDWNASTKGKLSSVRAQFDCLGGGVPGGKADLAAGHDESSLLHSQDSTLTE